jgi:hypothetical protein
MTDAEVRLAAYRHLWPGGLFTAGEELARRITLTHPLAEWLISGTAPTASSPPSAPPPPGPEVEPVPAIGTSDGRGVESREWDRIEPWLRPSQGQP